MADIKCEYTTCVNNDSQCMDDKYGFCTKQFIILNAVEMENLEPMCEDEKEVMCLNCDQYNWDKNKPFKHQMATPKQMSDALEGAE